MAIKTGPDRKRAKHEQWPVTSKSIKRFNVTGLLSCTNFNIRYGPKESFIGTRFIFIFGGMVCRGHCFSDRHKDNHKNLITQINMNEKHCKPCKMGLAVWKMLAHVYVWMRWREEVEGGG